MPENDTESSAANIEAELRWSAEERRQRERLFREAGCPPRHIQHLDLLDASQGGEWIRIRDRLAENVKTGFIIALLGKRGVGKTQLATSLIFRCSEQSIQCRYVKAFGLLRDIGRLMGVGVRGENREADQRAFDRWVNFPLLVIDEMYQRGGAQWEYDAMTNLIDRRYDQMKSTLLIANQTAEQFSRSIGDSVVSRMHECGDAIECNWPSFRVKGCWLGGDDK